MLVDERSQVGVDKDGIWSLNIDLTLGTPQLSGTEPTSALRHLAGTRHVAHICFDGGGRAGGRVLWTGRAALCLFQLPG